MAARRHTENLPMLSLTLLAVGFAIFMLVAILRAAPDRRRKALRSAAFLAWCVYAVYEGVYIREWLETVRGAPIRVDLIPIGLVLAFVTKRALWPATNVRPAAVQHPSGGHVCRQCGYGGPMKKWLRNYNVPQLAALALLCLFLVPGILFIAWAWGKFKCPHCGAVTRNRAAWF